MTSKFDNIQCPLLEGGIQWCQLAGRELMSSDWANLLLLLTLVIWPWICGRRPAEWLHQNWNSIKRWVLQCHADTGNTVTYHISLFLPELWAHLEPQHQTMLQFQLTHQHLDSSSLCYLTTMDEEWTFQPLNNSRGHKEVEFSLRGHIFKNTKNRK